MNQKTARSLRELSAEVATNPNSTAFVDLAAAYRERGDVERALRLCLRGLQRHPTHVEAHFELGRIYEAAGQRELALDEWAVVRQLAPEHLPSRLALVRLYVAEGRQAEATIELRAAQLMAPRDPRVLELIRELEAAGRRENNGGRALQHGKPALEPVRLGVGVEAILRLSGDGRVQQGRLRGRDGEVGSRMGSELSGVRAEGERVASYLGLGGLRGFVIEGRDRRIAATPAGEGLVVVVSSTQLPPGQAARALLQARKLLADPQSGGGE